VSPKELKHAKTNHLERKRVSSLTGGGRNAENNSNIQRASIGGTNASRGEGEGKVRSGSNGEEVGLLILEIR